MKYYPLIALCGMLLSMGKAEAMGERSAPARGWQKVKESGALCTAAHFGVDATTEAGAGYLKNFKYKVSTAAHKLVDRSGYCRSSPMGSPKSSPLEPQQFPQSTRVEEAVVQGGVPETVDVFEGEATEPIAAPKPTAEERPFAGDPGVGVGGFRSF